MQGIVHLKPNDLATLGYTDFSLISETDSFCTYRSRARAPGAQSVLIKIPVSEGSQAALIRQLEHELEFAGELNPEYVIRPIKIEQTADWALLILEDCTYPPLTQLLQAPIGVHTFLPVAIGITMALCEVHRCGLVHRAIRPENIFALPSGQAKLAGFGIATRLMQDRQPLSLSELNLGTLAYMAPELTGRMPRSIDSRSDLYALGINFPRMLTSPSLHRSSYRPSPHRFRTWS